MAGNAGRKPDGRQEVGTAWADWLEGGFDWRDR
jgi:hypothetical protein